MEIPERQPLRTTLGLYADAKAYQRALTRVHMRVTDFGKAILSNPAFACASSCEEVALTQRSVAELGFPEGATYKNISERALNSGLHFCPAEVGPALRLSYRDQPRPQCLAIAMFPLAIDKHESRIFLVAHSHGHGGDWKMLAGGNATYKVWAPDTTFLFKNA